MVSEPKSENANRLSGCSRNTHVGGWICINTGCGSGTTSSGDEPTFANNLLHSDCQLSHLLDPAGSGGDGHRVVRR